MPFIEENNYENLLGFQDKNLQLANEINLSEAKEKTAKRVSWILGILLFLSILGLVLYHFLYGAKLTKVADSHQLISKDEIESYEQRLQELDSINESLAVNNNTEEQASISDQLVYAVQIGAFEERDLSMYSSSFVNFKEIKANEFNKYALGNFETLEEAQSFRRELVNLGFEDAFIASYQNDTRLQIEPIN